MRDRRDREYYSICPTCGKRRYPTRGAAKDAARWIAEHPRPRAYRAVCGDWWHIGHLPVAVVTGLLGRAEIAAAARDRLTREETVR